MTLLDFVWMTDGRIVTAPGGLGGQCVDLVNEYLVQCFDLAPVRANAVDW